MRRVALVMLSGVLFPGVAWAASAPAMPCHDLLQLTLANTQLTEAVEVPADQPFELKSGFGPAVTLTNLPAHCLVHGEVNRHVGADGKEYGDRFEVRLPLAWQGRMLFVGGGGLDGVLNPALALQGPAAGPQSRSALADGYVVVTSDGGHQDASNLASEAAFGLDPESRKDYNYRSTKLVSDVAKQLLAHYYARPVQRAYFMGCSNGGREGMQMAERYPDAFDGVLAGAPAFDLTHAAIAEAWNTQQVASISPKGADGKPDLQRGLTEDDLKLVVHAVLEKCDALDGLKDGMIFNTAACHFDPSVLTCQEGKADGCLSAAKVKVIAALFSGPKDSQGRALYSSWPFDSGLAEAGWRVWITGLGPTPAINTVVTHGFYNGLALQGQGPKVEAASFDFDRDSARILAASADINATATDWSAFARHGAKLLLYHGVSDPIFSADDLVRYYRELEAANGGRQRTQEFARLFLVPGMNHCSGGPALDNFDALGTLQQWVEQDKAPARIVATGRAFPGRSRPLCPYPQYAQYDGKGNPEDAASFACKSESR